MQEKMKKVIIRMEDDKSYYGKVHSLEHFISLIRLAKSTDSGFLKVYCRTYMIDDTTSENCYTEIYRDPVWINVDKILYFRLSE